MALELVANLALVSVSGSRIVALQQGPGPTSQALSLMINVKGAVLNPGSITFKIEEVDPQATGTVIGTTSATSAAIAATGIQPVLAFGPVSTGTVRISWTVAGAGFSAADIDLSLLSTASSAGSGGTTNVTVTGVAAGVGTSVAALATSLVKAGARNLLSGTGRIDATAGSGTYYLLFIDANALPANGVVPLIPGAPPQKFIHASGADDPWSFQSTLGGLPVANGVVLALSTTEFTLTIAGAFLSAGIETT